MRLVTYNILEHIARYLNIENKGYGVSNEQI